MADDAHHAKSSAGVPLRSASLLIEEQ